jgi:hypothetical protein
MEMKLQRMDGHAFVKVSKVMDVNLFVGLILETITLI